MKHGDKLLAKAIVYCGNRIVLVCDGQCHKAWGINNRPKIQLDPDNEDDVIWLADDELGEAPIDPGIYEGGEAKPTYPDARLNKWCARECERSEFRKEWPKNWSMRRANLPDRAEQARDRFHKLRDLAMKDGVAIITAEQREAGDGKQER